MVVAFEDNFPLINGISCSICSIYYVDERLLANPHLILSIYGHAFVGCALEAVLGIDFPEVKTRNFLIAHRRVSGNVAQDLKRRGIDQLIGNLWQNLSLAIPIGILFPAKLAITNLDGVAVKRKLLSRFPKP